MNSAVPTIAPSIGASALRLSGFSDQEWWGRWTLGRQASVDFRLRMPTTLHLKFEGYMAQHDQRLNIFLDGSSLGKFAYGNLGGNMQFGKSVLLKLATGKHRLTFQSNLSSRSSENVILAPKDPRDLGIAFRVLDILPRTSPLPSSSLPIDLLHSNSVEKTGYYLLHQRGPYLVVAQEGFNAVFRTSTQGVINYSFVRSQREQQLVFSLDNHIFYQTNASPFATVIRGQIKMPKLTNSTHQINVRPLVTKSLQLNSYLLADTAVESSNVGFYVDRLTIDPLSNQFADTTLAVILAFPCLLMCLHFLLGDVIFFRRFSYKNKNQ